MFIYAIAWSSSGRPLIAHEPKPNDALIVVSDDITTHYPPNPQPRTWPKYIDLEVLTSAGMIVDDSGEWREFKKPNGTSIKPGEKYVLEGH